MKDLLILTPLPLETKYLLAKIKQEGLSPQSEQRGPMTVYSIPDLRWRFAVAGHGKVQFGIQTQFLLDSYKETKGVLCVGAAGALAKEVAIYDLVIAQNTIEHDYLLRFVKRDPPTFVGDQHLLQQARQMVGEFDFQLHIGSMASGDEDIIDSKRANSLALQTQALAVAWEGAGGARACQFNGTAFLEIRGITDRADALAPSNFSQRLQGAMNNIGEFLLTAFT